MNDPNNSQILITQQERQSILQNLAQRYQNNAPKLENQVFTSSRGIKSVYMQRLAKLEEQLQVYQQRRMTEAMRTNSTANANQSSPTLPQTRPTLNQLLTQPFVQLSANIQQTRMINSRPTLPVSMSPFNSVVRQREETPRLSSIQPQMRARAPAPTSIPPNPNVNVNNEILHQYVVGNVQNTTTNSSSSSSSSSGDRLLQQILLSNTDALAAKSNVPSNRTFVPQAQTQTQVRPQPMFVPRPPAPQLENNSFSILTGPISTPDDDILNLIKFLSDNLPRIRMHIQKYHNEGNADRVREIQNIYQQTEQFVTNPTYEQLTVARKIRSILQRASNPQPTVVAAPPPPPPAPPVVPPPTPQINCDLNEISKNFSDFISRDERKRSIMSKFFFEPLADVMNGVPHKKIRLDVENSSSIKFIEKKSSSSSSFVSRLDDELNEIPRGVFFIERISTERLDEDFLKKFGLTLRCQLIGNDFPLIPSLNLRISIDYPNEQPEILSLTKTSPPKLVFTDENPHLERISTYFICRLFKLERQHRIIDLLNIWRDSVESVL